MVGVVVLVGFLVCGRSRTRSARLSGGSAKQFRSVSDARLVFPFLVSIVSIPYASEGYRSRRTRSHLRLPFIAAFAFAPFLDTGKGVFIAVGHAVPSIPVSLGSRPAGYPVMGILGSLHARVG